MLRPETPFYLLGMGDRTKLMYKAGRLTRSLTGEVVGEWDISRETFIPEEYRIDIQLKSGTTVEIFEDESGVYIRENGLVRAVTESPLTLPRFEGHSYAKQLRVLHHDILINVINGLPVPNYFVYQKPWNRDAAMMAMCLRETDNLHLIRDWILSMTDPFDRNNAGHREPDNLGQVLYLVSLVADASHPLVGKVLKLAEDFRQDDYIVGLTDFAERPVYQTKWMKFGLRSLKLEDPYVIPAQVDEYSDLFWMDYRDEHLPQDNNGLETDNWYRAAARHDYPYLLWAKAHFYNWPLPSSYEAESLDYPISWEKEASQADYAAIASVSKTYAANRYAGPHTWHAAEMFLYLLDTEWKGQGRG